MTDNVTGDKEAIGEIKKPSISQDCFHFAAKIDDNLVTSASVSTLDLLSVAPVRVRGIPFGSGS